MGIGIVMADSGVPQVPETQGFTTATAISALGTVTETDNIVTQISGNHQGLPPGIMPLYYEWESVYASSYTENTIADQGFVTYTKGISFDTAGVAVQNQFNMKTNKIVEFAGLDTGRMISAESTLLDGVGTAMEDSEILLCPFASTAGAENPAFCNIVEEGSSVDLTIGSLTTGSAQRFIMLKASTEEEEGEGEVPGPWDLPASAPGVEVNYDIKLTGFGDIPASGSAQAFMNVHIQEARTVLDEDTAPKAEDLVYSESSTATGEITLFQKVMGYTSKITAPGPVEVN